MNGEGPVERWVKQGYDPRRRPWYQGAMELLASQDGGAPPEYVDELIHWTEPYTFFTTGDPGITASIAFLGEDGVRYVIGFDIRPGRRCSGSWRPIPHPLESRMTWISLSGPGSDWAAGTFLR